MSVPDIGRELGARWKALTAEAKKPFEEQAKADKERYAREKKAYDEAKRAAGGGGGGGGEEERDEIDDEPPAMSE